MVRKGWQFNKKVIKALLLSINRKITGERPVFTQEFQLIDPEDWGASVSAERSACSLKELRKKPLSVSGSPACTLNENFYISFRDQKKQLSAAEFYKLIPKR